MIHSIGNFASIPVQEPLGETGLVTLSMDAAIPPIEINPQDNDYAVRLKEGYNATLAWLQGLPEGEVEQDGVRYNVSCDEQGNKTAVGVSLTSPGSTITWTLDPNGKISKEARSRFSPFRQSVHRLTYERGENGSLTATGEQMFVPSLLLSRYRQTANLNGSFTLCHGTDLDQCPPFRHGRSSRIHDPNVPYQHDIVTGRPDGQPSPSQVVLLSVAPRYGIL